MLRDRGSEAIVRSTIELGRSLGLTVVAEGIETPEQWEKLIELGCRYGQGLLPLAAGAGRAASVHPGGSDLRPSLRSRRVGA